MKWEHATLQNKSEQRINFLKIILRNVLALVAVLYIFFIDSPVLTDNDPIMTWPSSTSQLSYESK